MGEDDAGDGLNGFDDIDLNSEHDFESLMCG